MKLPRLLFIVFVLSIILSGCQTGRNQTPVTPTESPSENGAYPQPSPIENEAYPQPAPVENEAYPQPIPPEASATESSAALSSSMKAYPELNDGDEVDWSKVLGIIMSGQVSKVVQTHDLKVYLTFKDGRTVVSVEPVIDEVMGLIRFCGDPCKDILIATE